MIMKLIDNRLCARCCVVNGFNCRKQHKVVPKHYIVNSLKSVQLSSDSTVMGVNEQLSGSTFPKKTPLRFCDLNNTHISPQYSTACVTFSPFIRTPI